MAHQTGNAKSIFLNAIDLDRGFQRDQYLEHACGEDEWLRCRVDELITSFENGGDFLEHHPAPLVPTKNLAADQSPPESAGAMIGPYKLLQAIGEGGFGVVYMAEQLEPVRRKVALKIIKPGMDTKEVIGRFEAERQALALMDHPNIAKVLDAGATEGGRPYFAMELVKGVPLLEFCDNNDLSSRDRLQLFVSICRAVQHAHQKGIIHRDLKPSNVMITLHDGQPVPKVIDFGVSKAIGQQLTERTLFTAYGQMIGTPAYMSPEQAEMSGLDIDTRSDIYSLGVLLYELLTGSTPLEADRLRGTAYAEIQRLIREEEPPKPSTRISTLGQAISQVAKHRGTDPRKLNQFVRGDLDWIVMRSLEKDRARRYETASGFAADIERFLIGEAIEARRPSLGYRLSKYARRHKALLATASMIGLALMLGILGTTWQAVRATSHRDRAIIAEQAAKEEAGISRAVLNFVNHDLLARANPHNEPNRDLKLTTVLKQATNQIEGQLVEQPKVEAAIRFTLGDTYFALGEHEAARSHLERARDLCIEHRGETHKETIRVLNRLAWLEHDEGRMASAEAKFRGLVDTAGESLGSDDPLTLDAHAKLADVLRHRGKFVESERLFLEAISAMQKVLGTEHWQTLLCRNDLALLYQDQGRIDEAQQLHAHVLEDCRRVLGDDHPRTIESIANLAEAYQRQERFADAEKLAREAFVRSRRLLGSDHPSTIVRLRKLAITANAQGRKNDAISLLNAALQQQNRILPPAHSDTIATLNEVVRYYRSQNRIDEITALYRQEIENWSSRRQLEPSSSEIASRLVIIYRRLGWHLNSQSQYDQALAAFHEAAVIGEEIITLRPEDAEAKRNLAVIHWNIAATYELLQRPQDARTSYEKSIRLFEQTPKQTFKHTDWGHFGQVLYAAGRYEDARHALRRGIELRGEESPSYTGGPRWWYLAMTLHQLGETELARSYYNELVAKLEADSSAAGSQKSNRIETANVLGIDLESDTTNQ